MSTTISGTVAVIQPTQTIQTKTGSTFTKRVLVLQTERKYRNTPPIEFSQERCALLDNLQIGQKVTVYFDLEGSEYNGRYYASASGYKIETATTAQSQQYTTPQNARSEQYERLYSAPPAQPTDITGAEDLPF